MVKKKEKLSKTIPPPKKYFSWKHYPHRSAYALASNLYFLLFFACCKVTAFPANLTNTMYKFSTILALLFLGADGADWNSVLAVGATLYYLFVPVKAQDV